MPKSFGAPERVSAAQHERDAVAMRIAGATYRQIGDKLGVTESAAARAVKRVLERTRKAADEDAETLRQQEAERLDALQLAVWPQAVKGHQGAVDRVLRIMARRAALLGLDAPTRQEVTGADGEGLTIRVIREDRPIDRPAE